MAIHEFLDGTKQAFGDVRHRAILHNTYGIWLIQEVFGRTIDVKKNTKTVKVAVREIAEQHIMEDLGFIPTPGDWLENMNVKVWMGGRQNKVVGRGDFLGRTVKDGK